MKFTLMLLTIASLTTQAMATEANLNDLSQGKDSFQAIRSAFNSAESSIPQNLKSEFSDCIYSRNVLHQYDVIEGSGLCQKPYGNSDNNGNFVLNCSIDGRKTDQTFYADQGSFIYKEGGKQQITKQSDSFYMWDYSTARLLQNGDLVIENSATAPSDRNEKGSVLDLGHTYLRPQLKKPIVEVGNSRARVQSYMLCKKK